MRHVSERNIGRKTYSGLMILKVKFPYWSIALIVILLTLEIFGFFLVNKFEHIDRMRRYLSGDDNPDNKPLVTSHPYMGSIATPLYAYNGIQRHNIDGYRGARVPINKDSLSYRILFLGGSTTYSVAIMDPDSTWPRQIKSKLEQILVKNTILSGINVEVINGGLPMATSAEVLTHYLFKYRYYKPDLVVIHSGINDALSYKWGYGKYNPDYSFWKNGFDYLKPLPNPFKWLLHSRFIGAVVVILRYNAYMELMPNLHKGDKTPADWFSDSLYLTKPEQNAFYLNIRSLIREAKADGSDILLVPVIYNKASKYLAPGQENGIIWHNELLKILSNQFDVPFCDITNNIEQYKSHWIDAVHLNSIGVELKSIKPAKSIYDIMDTNSKPSIDSDNP